MLKEFCEGKVGLCLSFLVVPNGRAGSEFACRDRLLVELVCNTCDGQVLEMVGLSCVAKLRMLEERWRQSPYWGCKVGARLSGCVARLFFCKARPDGDLMLMNWHDEWLNG